MNRARLMIADDHPFVLDGLRKLLEHDFDLVGAASNGKILLEQAARLRPDVVLMDIAMPVVNGIEAARVLRRKVPEARIVFLSTDTETAYIAEALRAGGQAYVVKTAAASELVHAILTVLRGRKYVTPLAVGDEPGEPSRDLTDRQREVLQLLAGGQTPREIAATLGVSLKTVEFHKSGLSRRLGLRGTAELTRYAAAHGCG